MCRQQLYQMKICSILIFMSLLIGFCMSQSNLQPERCSQTKPKNTKCPSKNRERRWIFHSIKGCKRSGFCKDEVAKYDNQTDLNYFLSEEDCQQACMSDIRCPVLESIPNGQITKGGVGTWGSKVSYSCNEGYSLVGSTVRRCLMNATWSATAPMCRVKCSEPSVPGLANMKFTPVQRFYKQGDTIVYDCITPYFGDSSSRVCLNDGTWSGAEPNCELQSVLCPHPDLVVHGRDYAPNLTVGSVVTYTCNTGYMLFGDRTRECNGSGQWSGQKPICWKTIIELHSNSQPPMDITNTIIELPSKAQNIWIIAKISIPHPFQIEDQNSVFHGPPLPISGLDFLGHKMKFRTILNSQEQEGNYSINIRGYEVFFTLVVKVTKIIPIEEEVRLLLGPVNARTTLDCNIQFTCVFQGSPSPDVTWYHNDVLVAGDTRRKFTQQQDKSLTTNTLKINNVSQSDLGYYVCVGNNGGDNITSRPAEVANELVPCSVPNSRRKKRSLQRSSLCLSTSPPDTVTVVGRVKRELTRLRAPNVAVYRLLTSHVLHRSKNKNISPRSLRTVVIDTNNSSRLKRNEHYILRGRIQDSTLLVYGHDSILRHTAELEKRLQLC